MVTIKRKMEATISKGYIGETHKQVLTAMVY